MTWLQLQQETRESPCIAVGHKWIATAWEAKDRHGIESPDDVLAWECLRCGAEATKL